MKFNETEKCAIFDKIAENYFEHNFGSMTKSDFETLLFSEYIEHCIKNNLPFDDYTLSKKLGITQPRIRALKERKELKYPYKDFDWRIPFLEAIRNAKYDSRTHSVKMIVQDVNVMNEIRNFLEQNGWYDECSLNKKLLTLPLECFVDVFDQNGAFDGAFTEEAKDKVAKIASSADYSVEKFLSDFTKNGFKSFLMKASDEVINEVVKLIPFGKAAKNVFDLLCNVIKNKK